MTLVTAGTTLLVLALCHEAAGQSPGFIALNGGGSYESAEDSVSGSTGGAGVGAGLRLSDDWTAAVDVWVPGYVGAGGEHHRDILTSIVAMRRSAAADWTQPYLLAGIGLGRTESSITTCLAEREGVSTVIDCTDPDVQERRRDQFSSASTYGVVGAGIEIPLWRRVDLAPEIRAHLTLGSVILRSTLGIRVRF